jgi:hypothetical protein
MRPNALFTGCCRPSVLAGCLALGAYFASFILFASCAAQTPATFPVDGVVENSLTRQPVARALVEFNSVAVLTDGEGRFELHLPEGDAYLSVRRPGYQGPENGGPQMQVRVHVSAKTQPVTLFLSPVASIVGHVALSSGDPAAGLQIAVHRRQIVGGHARWMSAGNAVTGDGGTFRLPALAAPASYVLCTGFSQDRFGNTAQGGLGKQIMGYPGACYPGGFDLKTAIAAPLALSPGQQGQLEISLTRVPFYPVSISVAGGNSGRPQRPMIHDRSGQPINASMRLDNQSGSYVFNLPNGSYTAETRGFGNPPFYGRVDFTVAGAPVSGITLVSAPMAPIPVEIHEEFNAAPPTPAYGGVGGIRSFSGGNGGGTRGDQPPVQIIFDPVDRPLDGNRGVNIHRDPTVADTFLVDPPPQGAYMVDVRSMGGQTYAASVTSGTTDLFREPLIVGPGGSSQPIQIVLRNDMGFLACSERADAASTSPSAHDPETNQPSRIPVVAIPIGSASHQTYPWFTGGGFAFQMPPLPLPPGKYLVLAFEHEREIDLDNAEAMARLAAHGQTVTIQPGATVNLQVDPIPDGEGAAE